MTVELKVYKTAFEWYSLKDNKDWVIEILYTEDGKMMPKIWQVDAGAKYMMENNIRPFPVNLSDSEIEWYNDQYSEVLRREDESLG